MPAITVKELIEQLQQFPQDAYVLTEGCDCIGPCNGASYPYEHRFNKELEGNPFADQKSITQQCVVLSRDDSL